MALPKQELNFQDKYLPYLLGYYLYVKPLGENTPTPTGDSYIALNMLLPLGLSLLAGFALRSAWAAVVLWLPIWQGVKTLSDSIITHFTT